MTHTIAKSFGLVLLGAALAGAANSPELIHPSDNAQAEKPALFTDPHWKKISVSREFVCEGANFGDFNHDGVQDVVAGPYWYEGPDFSKRHEYMKPEGKLNPDGQYSHNFLAFTYSFKHDRWDDIIILGFPGEDTSWYENPRGKEVPEGHWVRHKIFDHTDNESPAIVDLLAPGKPVLLCSTGGKMGYAQPDLKEPEKPWTFHPISPNKGYKRFTHGLGYGDVNADGRNDILVHDGWYEQPPKLDGDPEWIFHKADFGSGGAQMHVYDVNGDGRPDVITSLEAHGYGLAWFEQKADGSFEKHIIVGRQPSENPQGVKFTQMHAIDLVDMNGDGLKDIVTGKRFYAHGSHGDAEPLAPAVLYWFELKRGDGNKVEWIAHQIDNDSGIGTQVIARDINNDKRPAIVIGNKKGTFVFLQQPDKSSSAK